MDDEKSYRVQENYFPFQAILLLTVVLDYSQQKSTPTFKDEYKHVYRQKLTRIMKQVFDIEIGVRGLSAVS